MLYTLKGNNDTISPTVGFNVETVEPLEGVFFELFDVGGTEKVRNLWIHHIENTKGLVYVVDSNDEEQIEESRKELFKFLKNEEMKGIPIVIIANKQDLPNALSTTDLTNRMGLHTLTSHRWHIQAASATTGEGVFESMKKMANMIKRSK